MSTNTLRKLCDAMDALDGASITTMNGLVIATIDNARAATALAMRDAVDSFEIEAGQIDQESWRAGYESALEDFDITDEDVAAYVDEDGETAYDAIDGLIFREEISAYAGDTLLAAYADSAPGEEDEDVFVAACELFDVGEISHEAYERLAAATEG